MGMDEVQSNDVFNEKAAEKQEDLNQFEIIRKKMTKKCNTCIVQMQGGCEGWSKSTCIWNCVGSEDAINLVKEATLISDKYNILSDEDIDKVVNTLESNLSDENRGLRRIMAAEQHKNLKNPTGILANVSTNPETGKIEQAIPIEDIDEQAPTIKDLVLGDIRPSYTETVVKKIAEQYNMINDDAYKVLELIKLYKENQNANVYELLPLAIRTYVENYSNSTEISIQDACKEILTQFQSDLEMEEEFIDLQKSINGSFGELKSIAADIQLTKTRNSMENELLAEADKIESANKEAAEKYRKISKAYTNSYTFQPLIKYLYNISQKNKRKINNTDKYASAVNTFNEKYKYHTMNIKNIGMLKPVLLRILRNVYKCDWITDELVKKFIILICSACEKLSPDNIDEHTYMFYTVQNISCFDFVDFEKEGYEFADYIIKNIITILKYLDNPSKYIIDQNEIKERNHNK
jgi:hypothetical protein